MNEMETNAKKYIVSVLTSTPLTMTISQLNRDYRNMMGEEIPYHKLGYNSLEHFLKSIPDTVQVKGSGAMATVLPVISEKSKHVNELVTSQKVIKKKNSNRPTFPTQQRKHLQYQKTTFTNFNNQHQRQKIFYPPSHSGSSYQSVPEKPVQNTFIHQNDEKEDPKLNFGIRESVPEKTVQNPFIHQNGGKTDSKLNFGIRESVPEKTVQNTFIHRNDEKKDSKLNFGISKLPEKSPDIYKRLIDSHKPKNSLQIEEKSDVHNSSGCGRTRKPPSLLDKIPDGAGYIESNVPSTIRKNLKLLIGKYENGVWCAEVPRLYRLMFQKDLNYEEFGYISLSQLCTSLPSIFHYSRPAEGDFKLYDKSKPLPQNAEKTFTVASYTVGNRLSNEGAVSAVPNIDWDDVANFLPENVLKPGHIIPREFLPPETKEEDTIKIVVGEVYDLSKFWVYLDNGLLDNLMDEMQDFYRANASKYLIPDNLIREGIYCVQFIYREYHRAFIVDVLPDLQDTIRVLFIDYGTMTKVSTKGICFLHERFADLPAQAIRSRLADICPTEESVPWSKEASSTFRAMVKNRNIDAKVARVNWKEQILEAYLIDVTSPSKQFCLNTKLVERGFAQYPDKGLKKSKVDSAFKPLVKYIHLFPTFLELEHGYAPSTQEMDVLLNCDVPTSLCYPQYFSIDHSDERQTIKEFEEFYTRHLKKKRTCKSSYFDMSCVISKQFDMSPFKGLETEIAEFIEQNDAYSEYVEEEAPENISELYKQLEEIKKETAEKMQQDRELAEDIMKELEIIKYEGEASCSEPLFCESDENGDDGSESTMFSSKMTGSYESCNEVLDESKSGSTVPTSLYSFCDAQSSTSSKSTNPFLSDRCEEQEDTKEPLVLNPNNPFLSYLLGEVKEQNSLPASDNSSTSTVYEGYTEEVKVEQKWVNNENKEVKIEQRWLSNDNDVVSLVECLSITDAADTAQVSKATSMNSRDCAIQTSNEGPTPPSIVHQVQPMPPNLPYGGYQPPQPYGGYTPWSTADCTPFGYGPRYPGSGYGYADYMAPIQPWVMQMLWRMQMRPQYNSSMGPAYQQQPQYHPQVPYQQQPPYQQQFKSRGPLRPPPGFFPPLPAPSQGSSADTTNSPVTTPSPPAPVTRTNNPTDFYEVYNEQLKQLSDKK